MAKYRAPGRAAGLGLYVTMRLQVAGLVARVLGGARAGDLPIEQPTKFGEPRDQSQDRQGAGPDDSAIAAFCAPTR